MPLVLHGKAGRRIELLTYSEAADRLGMRPQTLRAQAMRGKLHSIRTARTAEYPDGTAFLLADEVDWYNRRRRGNGRALADIGPSPYVARYAELNAAGAALVPLLADTRDAAAHALAQLDAGAPARKKKTQTPAIGGAGEGEGIGASSGLAFLAGVGMLLIVALASLVQGRQPDAGTIAQLRTMPGAAELPRALRQAADLLDKAAA